MMASKIKQKLAQNLFETINNKYYLGQYEEFLKSFAFLRSKDNAIIWKWKHHMNPKNQPDMDIIRNNHKEIMDNGMLTHLKVIDADLDDESNYSVEYELNLKNFIKDTIDSNPTALSFEPVKKKVVFEFSSPNIAKPFHVGHLRSTMIGNCLSNIKSKLGKDVVRLNFLGDWGVQMGKIQVGVELLNYTNEDLKTNPVEKLFKAYVEGNRKSELKSEIYDRAKNVFFEMENENEEALKNWEKYKQCSLKELSETYEKLGVVFDEYSWESDHRRSRANKILQMLDEKGILLTDNMNRKVVKLGEEEVPLIKSDGTTLYLLRDLMALADRSAKHKFDEMYYVVENGQNLHFSTLFKLNNELELTKGKLEHVKFGRIQGMSTRKGKVTFLSDILIEARERVYEAQVKSKYTRIPLDDLETQHILGVSAVVINDLKQHRKKDYNFSWEKVLQVTGDTGVHMMYCYCRLNSLEENCGLRAATECDPEALMDPISINLIFEMAKFEEALLKADGLLEPCSLVSYLFRLVKCCNVAFKKLNVKSSGEHVGSQRLLMFNKCRAVLEEGFKLLGVRTVKKM